MNTDAARILRYLVRAHAIGGLRAPCEDTPSLSMGLLAHWPSPHGDYAHVDDVRRYLGRTGRRLDTIVLRPESVDVYCDGCSSGYMMGLDCIPEPRASLLRVQVVLRYIPSQVQTLMRAARGNT